MTNNQEKNGGSINEAIIISNASNPIEGVQKEYEYIESKYGICGENWDMKMQSLVHEEDKYYDKMDLEFKDGTTKTIYFDITKFYRNWDGLKL